MIKTHVRPRVASFALVGFAACCACSETGAPATDPLPSVLDDRSFSDHREVDIRFEGFNDAQLEGTLFLPLGPGPHGTVVLQGGSTSMIRNTFEEVSFALPVLGAVFSFDRRGFGASTGSLPPEGPAFYEALAQDVAAAVQAIKIVPEVDLNVIGLFGSSQGGWTVPLAASLSAEDVGFVIVIVGGVVSTGQDALYDRLTGYDVCERTSTSIEDINQALRDAGPSGFDPRASLEALAQPALWMYGGLDFSHSATLSVEGLNEITATLDKPWTITTFPEANHEFIANGTICQGGPPTVDIVGTVSAFIDGL